MRGRKSQGHPQERVFQAEGRTSAKSLEEDNATNVRSSVRRLGWVSRSE